VAFTKTDRLRDYQLAGAQKLVANKRMILADTMGLGKTATALKALEDIEGRVLIVCGLKAAVEVWRDEIGKWTDSKAITAYGGNKPRRIASIQRFLKSDAKYLITNAAHLEQMSKLAATHKFAWAAQVFDEYHLTGLTNPKNRAQAGKGTKFFETARYNVKAPYLFFISGTPLSAGPQDLWPVLYLIDRKKFRSFWKYAYEHCIVKEEFFGKKIEGTPRDPRAFRRFLRPYMVRRTKKAVAPELPAKQRGMLSVEMSERQRALYQEITEEMIAELDNGDLVVTPNAITKLLRLRQVLVSPQLLGDSDVGGALPALAEFLELELAAGNPVAVFTPFRGAVDLVRQHCVPKGTAVFTVVGGMKEGEAQGVARSYEEHKGPKLLVGTIKSALAYSIPSVAAEYFLGYEWSYNENAQAEDRGDRITRVGSLRVNYLKHAGTVDAKVLRAVATKRRVSSLILRSQDLRYVAP